MGCDPGTVYLFGKVAKEGSDGHASCCVRIPSVERTLYFVPKEGLFDPKDYRLHYLETKAKEDPQQRDALVAYLDQVADPLKNEAQSVLKAKHVQGPFKMKIVRRNYAFDTPSVSHGLQYVLKVRCIGAGMAGGLIGRIGLLSGEGQQSAVRAAGTDVSGGDGDEAKPARVRAAQEKSDGAVVAGTHQSSLPAAGSTR